MRGWTPDLGAAGAEDHGESAVARAAELLARVVGDEDAKVFEPGVEDARPVERARHPATHHRGGGGAATGALREAERRRSVQISRAAQPPLEVDLIRALVSKAIGVDHRAHVALR